MSAKASIAARCRALFPTSVRLRGEARARDHHLILGERRPTTLDGITASGIGSPISTQTASTQRASTRYACRIDWRNAEHGRIGLRCGCPEFIAHGPCEHLWALLLLADERNVA